MGALAMRPFFDNVWTTQWQNSSTWAGDGEYYVELAWLLSVLSAGAVGFGDMPGNTNRTLLMTCCRSDGVLLTPSLPSHYLDAVYLPSGSDALLPALDTAIGRIYQAPSFIPQSPPSAAATQNKGNYDLSYYATSPPATPAPAPFLTLLSIDINTTLLLQPQSLTPSLTPSTVNARAGGPAAPTAILGYAALSWARGFSATAALCGDGAPASACAVIFDPQNPLPLYTGVPLWNFTHSFDLFSFSPIYLNGWSLLGELEKAVRVSPGRISWVSPVDSGLQFGVLGEIGEAVTLAVIDPTTPRGVGNSGGLVGVVKHFALTIPSTGEQNVTCKTQGCFLSS